MASPSKLSAAANRLIIVPEAWRERGWHALLLWTSLSIIILMAALLYNTQKNVYAETAQLEWGQHFERDLLILTSNLKDVETGAHGYALTGNEHYLERYRAGKPNLVRELGSLDKFLLSDSRQDLNIKQLKRLSLSHIKMLDELVAYVHSNGSRTVRSDLVFFERDQALMDEIRLVVDRIVVDTQRQNQAMRQILQKQMLISSAMVGIIALASIITIVMIYMSMKKELRRRIDTEVELKNLTVDLENRINTSTTELNNTNKLLSLVLQHIPDTVLFIDIEDNYKYILWNHVANHEEGPHSSDVIGMSAYASLPLETADLMRAADQEAMAVGHPTTTVTENVQTPIGSRTIEYRRIPVQDQEGRWRYLLGIVRDITDQRNLELQIRQIQRLDAVGHLTGGMAHDFNNLLAIILGNCDLLREQLADGSESARLAGEVIAAAERGAELTRRLLAFARQQHLEPTPIKLNERLPEIGALLKRTLGENISLDLIPGTDIWSALVDPAQVDDALVNLAINARDAMPSGGHIVIETANVVLDEIYAAAHSEVIPGDYVLLSVSDTGSGMTPETMTRAFEPFYTTKDVGKGTGLGLSQVYGWVKQSGGHIKIYSEVGHGTTIKLYLPRAILEVERHNDPTTSFEATPTGTETILVVEDNPNLRSVVLHQLHDLGYSTLEAEDAHAALRLVESGTTCDLIFTDVIMPGGMTGYELAKTVRASRPEVKVILTSGYTEQAARVGNGDFDKYQVLSKPYRKHDLARALRNALDERR
ncbi:MAG: hypothetical protein C0510_04160 [Erythrobacter sp.]|nr:hypothetical protein [Erythrobacter sp.]